MTDEQWDELWAFAKQYSIPPDPFFFPAGLGVPIHVIDDLEDSPRLVNELNRRRIEVSRSDYEEISARARHVEAT